MNEPAEKQSGSMHEAVKEIARRLKSPPLLLGYGAILAIAIVAMTVGAEFSQVAWTIVALALISLVVWAVFEIVKIRRTSAEEAVNFKSGDVGEKGKFTGIENKGSSSAGSKRVNISVGRLDGEVKGIVVGEDEKENR